MHVYKFQDQNHLFNHLQIHNHKKIMYVTHESHLIRLYTKFLTPITKPYPIKWDRLYNSNDATMFFQKLRR